MQLDPLEESILDAHVIERGDLVLVAVSGGADSMALATALCRLRDTAGITVALAHYDHQLRPDSGRDVNVVRAFAEFNDAELHTEKGDVAELAREAGQSIELTARELRYQFLQNIADKIGATRIATGHTQDDQVETVLMRIMRGTGMRGLAGIPAVRDRIVRPLLERTHKDTIDYCTQHKTRFVEDPSNKDTKFTRNRIRHSVLPGLRGMFPDTDVKLLRLAREASEQLKHIRRVTDLLLDKHLVEEKPGTWVLQTAELPELDDMSFQVLIADALSHRIGAHDNPSRIHFTQIAALYHNSDASGKSLSLPGVSVRFEHSDLVFVTENEHPSSLDVIIEGDFIELDEHTITIERTTLDKMSSSPEEVVSQTKTVGLESESVAYFDSKLIQLPLRVRRPERGDRMRPFGMEGRKKLSDIFIDRKIQLRHRGNALVIEDEANILWLVGVTTSEHARVKENTSAITMITVRQCRP